MRGKQAERFRNVSADTKYTTEQAKAQYDAVEVVKDANGNLLAPNGKPSNLPLRQWKMVRTEAFKEWFGDWENDAENASKVVDENGEPMVVYHGSPTIREITSFYPKNENRNFFFFASRS